MNGMQSGYSTALGESLLTLPARYAPRWIAVRARSEKFHQNLSLTPNQFQDGLKKRQGVVTCLNRHYYGSTSDWDNSFLIGSWAKDTAIRRPRDVDLYFVVPYEVYLRFQNHRWNRQSALLQEIKNVLSQTHSRTAMRGDGQVVLVQFDSYDVEVVPAIALTNGRYWICDTHDGGSYRETDPWAEVRYIEAVDKVNAGNVRPLIRMLKAWQEHCSVPIKSFQLELLAADFIQSSLWRLYDFFWFDWIIRDFFAYAYHRANSSVVVPGTSQPIFVGNLWQSRTASAYYRAVRACDHERENRVENAGDEWQKIFGQQVPRTA